MNDNRNRFYINPDTQERVRVTYRVHLTMPAIHDGYVEIEATSEEEAAQIALEDPWTNVDWDCDDSGNRHGIEVFEVECDDPPSDAILIEQGYYIGNANLGGLFEAEAPSVETPLPSQKGES